MSDKTAFVRRVQFEDTCSQLPCVRQWAGQISKPDVFICALGFEDRSVVISDGLAKSFQSTMPKTISSILCTYSTNYEDNILNEESLRKNLDAFCSDIQDVSADSPQTVRKAILDAISKADESRKCKIIFDISAASGSLILSIFKALIEVRHRVAVEVIYCEPQVYFPLKKDYTSNPEKLVESACAAGDESSVAEYGVAEVEFNELYPGYNVESRPERVLAIPAFRTTRLVRCLAHISDQLLASPGDSIYWVISEPPASELKWRKDLQERIVNVQLAKFVGLRASDTLAPKLTPTNHTVCSTRDYRDIMRQVMEQADAQAGSNLSLVHMGSKLQSVGVALALAVRSEIAVCSSKPLQFNPLQYSQGVGSKWVLDLSDIETVIKNLSLVGTLSLVSKIETSRDQLPSF